MSSGMSSDESSDNESCRSVRANQNTTASTMASSNNPFAMSAKLSSSSIPPVVSDVDDDDYGCYCIEDSDNLDNDEDESVCEMEDLFSFLHAIEQHAVEDEDENDDCSCPQCTADRVRRFMSDDDSECNCSNCIAQLEDELLGDDDMPFLEDRPGKRVSGGNEDTEDDDESADGTSCAICFSHPKSSNPLVTLPCCGGPNEEIRTTRFCQACIIKTVSTQHKEAAENRYGSMPDFVQRIRANEPKLGECPRCRMPLCVRKQPEFSVQKSSFEQVLTYATMKDVGMKERLFFLAHAHHHYIPIELLEMDVERATKLSQWGIISTVKAGKLYKIDPAEDQKKLFSFMTSPEHRPEFEDDNGDPISDEDWQLRAFSAICTDYWTVMFGAIKSWKLKLAFSLGNQAMILFWKYQQVLPRDTANDLGVALSFMIAAFNITLLSLLLVLAVFVGSFGLIGFALIKLVSWFIWTSRKPDGIKTLGKYFAIATICCYLRCHCGLSLYKFILAAILRGTLRLATTFVEHRYDQLSSNLMDKLAWAGVFWYLFGSLSVVTDEASPAKTTLLQMESLEQDF